MPWHFCDTPGLAQETSASLKSTLDCALLKPHESNHEPMESLSLLCCFHNLFLVPLAAQRQTTNIESIVLASPHFPLGKVSPAILLLIVQQLKDTNVQQRETFATSEYILVLVYYYLYHALFFL